MQKVKFVNKGQANFFSALRTNVENYFKETDLPKVGGNKILIKALVMFSMYLFPYFLILFGHFTLITQLGLAIIMGLGMAGTGMSVMHDAIHGSFSDKKWVNDLFGASIYFMGGNAYNWEVQHNQLHHTYTNIHSIDEDITGKFMLRLNVAEKKKYLHRYQHIYAFFLYSLMTLSFLWKDFKEIGFFNSLAKTGFVKAFTPKELIILVISKLAYLLFIMIIPIWITNLSFGEWFVGFMAMHITAGLILSTIFQLAHVVEGAEQPIPDDNANVENSWAVHQLNTTSNFFGGSSLLSWYIGGLDYQIEHHLFPKISHIYYKDISKIVAQTASDFGFTYNSKGGFFRALYSHIAMLKKLGISETI